MDFKVEGQRDQQPGQGPLARLGRQRRTGRKEQRAHAQGEEDRKHDPLVDLPVDADMQRHLEIHRNKQCDGQGQPFPARRKEPFAHHPRLLLQKYQFCKFCVNSSTLLFFLQDCFENFHKFINLCKKRTSREGCARRIAIRRADGGKFPLPRRSDSCYSIGKIQNSPFKARRNDALCPCQAGMVYILSPVP